MYIDPKKGVKAREKSKPPHEIIEELAKLRKEADEKASLKIKNVLTQLDEMKKAGPY